jgi:hypothetical protein
MPRRGLSFMQSYEREYLTRERKYKHAIVCYTYSPLDGFLRIATVYWQNVVILSSY